MKIEYKWRREGNLLVVKIDGVAVAIPLDGISEEYKEVDVWGEK